MRLGPAVNMDTGRIEVHEPETDGELHTTKRRAGDAGVGVLADGVTELPGLRVHKVPDGAGFVLEVAPGRAGQSGS